MSLYDLLKTALVDAGLANPETTDHKLAFQLLKAMGVESAEANAEEQRRRHADPMRKWAR